MTLAERVTEALRREPLPGSTANDYRECVRVLADTWAEVRRLQAENAGLRLELEDGGTDDAEAADRFRTERDALRAELAAHVGCHTEAEYGAAILQAQAGAAAELAAARASEADARDGYRDLADEYEGQQAELDALRAELAAARAEVERLKAQNISLRVEFQHETSKHEADLRTRGDALAAALRGLLYERGLTGVSYAQWPTEWFAAETALAAWRKS